MTEAQTLFTPEEAAALLRFSRNTLAAWRSKGQGPAYLKMRGSVRYLRTDLDAWVNCDEPGREALEASSECHRLQRGLAKRARGRKAVTDRKARILAEPECRDCRAEGISRPSVEVDHIIPYAHGGTDDDDNIRCLCKPCHAIRTKEQKLALANGVALV